MTNVASFFLNTYKQMSEGQSRAGYNKDKNLKRNSQDSKKKCNVKLFLFTTIRTSVFIISTNFLVDICQGHRMTSKQSTFIEKGCGTGKPKQESDPWVNKISSHPCIQRSRMLN